MIVSGFVSYLIETNYFRNRPKGSNRLELNLSIKNVIAPGLLLILGFVTLEVVSFDSVYWELARIFSTMSITLFGGGYVFIPMMQQIIVDQKGWLTSQEFSDAIAMGQITPGPILISAAFVGFKLKGIVGAAVSTISIFLPSAILMLVVGQLYKGISDNPHVILVFKGVKTSIIGLVLFSVFTITYNSDEYVYVALLGLVSFAALNKFSINPILLILLTGMLGIFVFY
jgi:chromate transporter